MVGEGRSLVALGGGGVGKEREGRVKKWALTAHKTADNGTLSDFTLYFNFFFLKLQPKFRKPHCLQKWVQGFKFLNTQTN